TDRAVISTFPEFRKHGSLVLWDQRPSRCFGSGRPTRSTTPSGAERVLGAGVIGVSPCWRNLPPQNNWNFWNGWSHWNRFLLRCVQSDGGQRCARQTENSFRQSQTILRDLKHHSCPTFPITRFERLERSAALERLEQLKSLNFLVTGPDSPTLSASDSN